MSEVSASIKRDLYNQQVLEDALREGPFSVLISEARTLMEILLTTDMSPGEIQLFLDDLNKRSERYIGAHATLHGRAVFAEVVKAESDSDDIPKVSDTLYAAKGNPAQAAIEVGEKRYFEELAVAFDGFRIIDEPILIDDEIVAHKKKVVMGVTRFASPHETALRPEILALTGLAEIDESHLVFKGMSIEHAQMWLAHFAPNTIDEIDTTILNAPTSRDALLCLKTLSFTSPLPELSSEFEAALDVYLGSIMDIDKNAPYILALSEGEVILENPDRSQEIGMVATGSCLADVEKVLTWKMASDTPGSLALAPHLSVSVLRPDPDMPSTKLIIPSVRIVDIVSSRAQFYGQD